MSEFSMQQEVVVWGGVMSREPIRVVKILDIGKRKIKCSDGSEWGLNGYAWGTSRDLTWHKSRISPANAEHRETIFRNRVVRQLQKMAWDKLTTDQLREAIALLDEAKEMERLLGALSH